MQVELSAKNVTWKNSSSPAPEELAALVRESNLLPVDAEFIAQTYHHPEITLRGSYLLLLIHVPVFNKELRITSGTPLYLIATLEKVWTLHYEPIIVLEKLLKDFTDHPDKPAEYFEDGGIGVALHIVSAMYSSAAAKLERLYKHINIAEDAVFSGNERKMVEEVSVLTRDVMDFRKIIRPQQRLFARLPAHPLLTDNAAIVWQRIAGQVNKLWDMLESLAESVSEVSHTNTTLLEYKQGEILRVLTYYSIVSIPLVIMGQSLSPFEEGASPWRLYVYWGNLVFLMIVLILVLLRFRGKRIL